MTHIDIEPPSKDDLWKTTAAAVGIAFFVLVFFVLPAEFGIDPTGFGGAIGLVHDDAPADVGSFHPQDAAYREQTFTIEVPASGAWRETKLDLAEGMSFVFAWNATGVVEYDLHHDAFGSYDTGEASQRHGSFTAPADGQYGWAFRSPLGEAQTITLQVTGYWNG